MLICRDIDFLMPKFASVLMDAITECHQAGYDIFIFETWRSPMRQAMLQKKGDATTKAGPWQSMHQFGLAADLAFGGPKKWYWPDASQFEKPMQIMQNHGLEGIGPQDIGHVQWKTSYRPLELYALHQKFGILGIWDALQSA